jgi:hypothetical protein
VCPNARKSAIRAYKFRENTRKKLVGEGKDPSPSIFFSSLLERFYATEIPKSYLNGTEDNALPQGAEWGWHPRMSSRLGLFRLIQMPGSHEVIFTNPGGLAAKLIEAGRD